MLKKIRHHLKKRQHSVFKTETNVDWEFVISISLAVIFGLISLSFFLKSAFGIGIGMLAVAIFLLIPEESISRWIKMNFTWKHKAVILIILLAIFGYFYLQQGEPVETVEVQPPADIVGPADTTLVDETGSAAESDTESGTTPETDTEIDTGIDTTPAIEEQPAPIGQVFEIEMSDHLEPADLTIPVGATVIWKNLEKRPHLIHIYVLNGGYQTITVGEKIGLVGDTWEYTFTEEGVFNYRDTVFNWRGIITVE